MQILAKTKQRPFFKRDPWTTLAITIGLFIVSQIVAVMIVSLYPAFKDWTEAEGSSWLRNSVSAQFMYRFSASALIVISLYYLLKNTRVTWSRLGIVKPQLRDAVYAILAYGLYFITYIVAIILIGIFFPGINLEQEQKIGFDTAVSTGELWMVFGALVILPPLAEEFLFRGFVFSSFRARYRLRYAIIFTSLLFGVLHLQFGSGAPLLWVAGIDTFILSCYLCLLREKTGGITAPIVLHAIKNLVAFSILFGPRLFS